MLKNHVIIYSVNPLCFIIGEVDVYIEKNNGNKYLVFASIDKKNEVLTKYTKLQNKIKNLIKKINDKPGVYEKEFIKIKFDSDDSLSLNKIIKL